MIWHEDGYAPDMLQSKEEVAHKGDPLSMILYSIGMLPLTIEFKNKCLTVYNRGMRMMQGQVDCL